MSRQAEEAQRFSERIATVTLDCDQCGAADVPVILFQPEDREVPHPAVSVCAECLRAAIPLLKHYVSEERRKCASPTKT